MSSNGNGSLVSKGRAGGNGNLLCDEDKEVFQQLTDTVDKEAFQNLAENASRQGRSVVELICDEPKLTSRPAIRKQCLKRKKKGFFASLIEKLFGRKRGD